MTTTTQTEEQVVPTEANTDPDAKRPRKRRMAREPKADAADAIEEKSTADVTKLREPRGPSKIGAVIVLLKRPEGATLAEMVDATGWLPHTTRAALTDLRKKGHSITKDKRDEVPCYSISSPVA